MFEIVRDVFNFIRLPAEQRKAAQQQIPFPVGTQSELYNGQVVTLIGEDELGNPIWSNTFPGTRVDYARAVGDLHQSSLLMAPVKWLGRTLPEAPMYIAAIGPHGQEADRSFDHPLVQLFNRPNPFYGGKQMWKAFACSWVLNGNVYIWKRKNLKGQTIELWYLPHTLVTPHWPEDGSVFIDYYIYKVNNKKYQIPVDDLLHFRDGIDPNNQRLGLSGIASVLREVYSDNERANFEAALLTNYGVTSLMIAPEDKDMEIDDDDAQTLKTSMQRQMSGDQRGKISVASVAVKMHKLGFTPAELDLSALNRIPESRVASVTGINGIVLGYQSAWEHSIFNNVSQAREEAYETYLIPLKDYIADELNTQMLPEYLPGGLLKADIFPHATVKTEQVRWDYSLVRALQDDRDKLFTRIRTAFQGLWIDRAEARSATGYEARPADVGVYWAPPDKASTIPSGPMLGVGGQSLHQHKADDEENITEDDIDRAVRWWERNTVRAGIPEAAGLINATRIKPNGGA